MLANAPHKILFHTPKGPPTSNAATHTTVATHAHLLRNLETPGNLCLKHAIVIILLTRSPELLNVALTPALQYRLRDIRVVEVEKVDQIITFLEELLLLIHHVPKDLLDQCIVGLARVGGCHVDHDVVGLAGLQAEQIGPVRDGVGLNQKLNVDTLDAGELGHGGLKYLEELEVGGRVWVAEGVGELGAAEVVNQYSCSELSWKFCCSLLTDPHGLVLPLRTFPRPCQPYRAATRSRSNSKC